MFWANNLETGTAIQSFAGQFPTCLRGIERRILCFFLKRYGTRFMCQKYGHFRWISSLVLVGISWLHLLCESFAQAFKIFNTAVLIACHSNKNTGFSSDLFLGVRGWRFFKIRSHFNKWLVVGLGSKCGTVLFGRPTRNPKPPGPKPLINHYLENQLLLISINFTPKTSHFRCLKKVVLS